MSAVAAARIKVAIEGGRLLRLTLAAPPGNVLDIAAIEELRAAVARHSGLGSLRAILIDHEGPNFSYGASVPEHLPGSFDVLIPAFHALLRELIDTNLALIAAVSGQTLGAGLELASICQRIVCSPDAKLGQPEIRLGVFAPAASAALPLRVGQRHADELLLGGAAIPAPRALQIGLVDEIAAAPADAARSFVAEHLAPKSAASLRFAVRAARAQWRHAFLAALAEVERLYVFELMSTPDAVEGLRAFVEKRKPAWREP